METLVHKIRKKRWTGYWFQDKQCKFPKILTDIKTVLNSNATTS